MTLRHVKSMQYSVIVFDTAPTGHTLRFLSFPSVLEKALGKISSLGGRLGPMLSQVCIYLILILVTHYFLQFSSMMGGAPGAQDDLFAKLDSMRAVINEVNTQFKDPVNIVTALSTNLLMFSIGKDHLHLCLHF